MDNDKNLTQRQKSAIINMILYMQGRKSTQRGKENFLKRFEQRPNEQAFALDVFKDVESMMKERGCEILEEKGEFRKQIEDELNAKYGVSEQFLQQKSAELKVKTEGLRKDMSDKKEKWEEQDRRLQEQDRKLQEQIRASRTMQQQIKSTSSSSIDSIEQNSVSIISEEHPQSKEKHPQNEVAHLVVESGENVDFDTLYQPSNIDVLKNGDKNISHESNVLSRTVEIKEGNTSVFMRPTGKIKYVNSFKVDTYVEQYSLTLLVNNQGELKTVVKTVYSNLDWDKLNQDTNYRKAALSKLLTIENVERPANKGYIGELCFNAETGEYQLQYLPENYTAVKTYQEQSERKLKEIMEEYGEGGTEK